MPEKINQHKKSITNKDAASVASLLSQKGMRVNCPACGSLDRNILSVFSTLTASDEAPNPIGLGNRTLPAAVVVCNNCGFISFHSLIALGLLPEA
jgi:hypothetical protein